MDRKKKASKDTRRPPRRPRSSTRSSNPTTSPPPSSQSPPIGSPSGVELTSFRQEPLSSVDSSLPQTSSPPAAPAHDVASSRPPLQPTDGPKQRISIGRSQGFAAPGGASDGSSSSSGQPPSRPPSHESVGATRQRINPDEPPIMASSPASQTQLATHDIGTFIHPLASPPAAPSGGQPQFLASAPILQVRIPPIVGSPGFSQISPWSYENPSLLDSSFSPGMSPFTTPTGGQWQSLATAPRQQEQQQQHQQKHGSRDRTPFDEESVGSLGSQSSDGSSVKAPFSDQVKSLDALLTTPDPLGALGRTPLTYFNPEEEDDYLGSEMKKLEDSRRSLQQELDEANLAILIESPEKKSPQELRATRTDATTTLKQQLFPGKDEEDKNERILPSAVATVGGGIYDDEEDEKVVLDSDDVSKSQSWLQYLRFRNSPSSKDGVSPSSFSSAVKRKAESSPPTESTTNDSDLKRAASTALVNDEGRERRDSKVISRFDPSNSLLSDDSLFHSLALFSERVNDSVPTPDRAAVNPDWNAISPAVSPHPDVSSRQSWVVTPDTFSSDGRGRDETMTPISVRLEGASFSSAMSSPRLALIGSPDSVEYSEFTQGSQSPGTSFQLLNESLQTPQAPGQPSPENTNLLFPGTTSLQQTPGNTHGQSPRTSLRLLNDSLETPLGRRSPDNLTYESNSPASTISMREHIDFLRRTGSTQSMPASLLNRWPASASYGYHELSSPPLSNDGKQQKSGRKHPWSKRTTFSVPPPDTSSPSMYSASVECEQFSSGDENEPSLQPPHASATTGVVMTTPTKTSRWTLPGLSDSPAGSIPASPIFVHQDISVDEEEGEGYVEFQFEPHPEDWKAATPNTFQGTTYDRVTSGDESLTGADTTLARHVTRPKTMFIYKCCLGMVAVVAFAVALSFGFSGGGPNGRETPDSGTGVGENNGTQSFPPSTFPSKRPTATTPPSISVQSSQGPMGSPTWSPTISPLDYVALKLTYGILVDNGITTSIPNSSYSPDLIKSMNRLASEVFLDFVSNLGHRLGVRQRKLSVMLVLPTSIEEFTERECPVPTNSTRCETVTAVIVLESGEESWQHFKALLEVGIAVGRLQYYLDEMNPNSPVTILDAIVNTPRPSTLNPVLVLVTPSPTKVHSQSQTPAYPDPPTLNPEPAPTDIVGPMDPPTLHPEPAPTDLSAPVNPPSKNPISAPTDVIAPVDPPTRTPTTAPTDLLSLLVSISFDGGMALKDDNSAQHQAYKWLLANRDVEFFSDQVLIQRYAMATFYYSTGGQNWYAYAGWLGDDDECKWYSKSGRRDVCNSLGQLTNLELDFNDLEGTLPPELALLSNSLERIDLRGGPFAFLSGTIPTEFGLLTNMQYFLIRANSVTGTLPSELGNWLPIQQLDIAGNQFSGAVPTDFGNFRSLSQLEIGSNRFSGWLPSEIGQLTDCLMMNLEDNMLSGALPSELGQLNKLQDLLAGMNLFSALPSELGRLSFLDSLSLHDNDIQGTIPTDLGRLRRLSEFVLIVTSTHQIKTSLCSNSPLLRF
jgi:hypothetical protein